MILIGIHIPLLADDAGSWVEVIFGLLVMFFIFIGPILKLVTKSIKEKIAKSRGVEVRKDKDTSVPVHPIHAGQKMMDEIASLFGVKIEKPEPEVEVRWPSRLRSVRMGTSRKSKNVDVREKTRRGRVPEVEAPPKPVWTEAEELAFERKHQLSSVGKVTPVKALETKREKKSINILERLPKRLTGNQKAILLNEILRTP